MPRSIFALSLDFAPRSEAQLKNCVMQLRIKNINQGMKCRCPQSIVHKVEIGHLYRKATKTLLDWKRAGLA